ncbi:cupin domain-containing protein [Acrocarpospora catenulata]|uniref:cupin domain-containing protein n=1 Tax=Acrocarpospora catenulata TaxID=2836182 RepID=UPI001BDB28FD|nr:cupin domain-containing protein [Acrocarpospora catenulata]
MDNAAGGTVWAALDAPFGTTVLSQTGEVTLLLTRGADLVTTRHLHAWHDEFGHLVRGSGEIEIDGVPHPVTAGSTWEIRRGTPHGGRFDGEFTVLVWFTPGDDLAAPDRVNL